MASHPMPRAESPAWTSTVPPPTRRTIRTASRRTSPNSRPAHHTAAPGRARDLPVLPAPRPYPPSVFTIGVAPCPAGICARAVRSCQGGGDNRLDIAIARIPALRESEIKPRRPPTPVTWPKKVDLVCDLGDEQTLRRATVAHNFQRQPACTVVPDAAHECRLLNSFHAIKSAFTEPERRDRGRTTEPQTPGPDAERALLLPSIDHCSVQRHHDQRIATPWFDSTCRRPLAATRADGRSAITPRH